MCFVISTLTVLISSVLLLQVGFSRVIFFLHFWTCRFTLNDRFPPYLSAFTFTSPCLVVYGFFNQAYQHPQGWARISWAVWGTTPFGDTGAVEDSVRNLRVAWLSQLSWGFQMCPGHHLAGKAWSHALAWLCLFIFLLKWFLYCCCLFRWGRSGPQEMSFHFYSNYKASCLSLEDQKQCPVLF